MDRADFDRWKAKDVARLLSLVEAERRYFQEMVAAIPVGMAVVSRSLTLASTNRAFRDIFQLASGSVYEMDIGEAGLPAAIRQQAESVLATGGEEASFHPGFQTPGGPRDLRVTLRPFRNWDEHAEKELLVTVEDLTSSTGQLHGTIGDLPAVIWELDPVTFRFRQVFNADKLSLPETAWKMGADFWVSRVNALDLAFVRGFYESTVRGGAASSCDYRSTSAQGAEIWLRDLVTSIPGAAGRPAAIHGITLDITHAKLREDAAAQSAQAAALSRLSGRVSHDCNNFLQIVTIQAEDLLQSLDPGNPWRPNVQGILRAADRLKSLTEQLASNEDAKNVVPRPISIDRLLSDIDGEIRALLPNSVQFRLEAGGRGTWVEADSVALANTVKTLVRRAVEAMPGGGVLTIATGFAGIHSASSASPGVLPPGDWVSLEIRDTGAAMPRDILDRLWEPPVGESATRKSIAQLYAVVRAMGGLIFARSEIQQGTCFTLYLRQSAGSREPEPAAVVGKSALTARKTVLVVDDEASIRSLMIRALQREGFEAMEAGDGRSALELARNYAGTIHLLVTDIMMPGINGFEMATEARTIRPELAVLFMSGYTGIQGFDPAHLPPASCFLQKPFSLSAFLKMVRELLEPPNGSGA